MDASSLHYWRRGVVVASFGELTISYSTSDPVSTGMDDRLRVVIKKVKFSHTRYQALGPELISVYRQSARW